MSKVFVLQCVDDRFTKISDDFCVTDRGILPDIVKDKLILLNFESDISNTEFIDWAYAHNILSKNSDMDYCWYFISIKYTGAS